MLVTSVVRAIPNGVEPCVVDVGVNQVPRRGNLEGKVEDVGQPFIFDR